MKRWSYSLGMLIAYLGLFLFWQHYPSRLAFVGGGVLTAAVLTYGMIVAARRNYFANRLDLILHAYVIFDILIEGLCFEGLHLMPAVAAESSKFVLAFHSGNNFWGCAAVFTLLIGGYRWIALRRDHSTTAMSV